MSYVDSNLSPGETVVYRAKLHAIIFLPGIILTPLIIGLPMLLSAWIRRANTELAVTSKRVIAKVGLFHRTTLELNLSKVETIGVDQSLLGRILNYGTVVVVGTGGTKEPFPNIADPMAFRKAVQSLSH